MKATTRRVDDGVWHEATLRRAGKEGRVTVDGTAADFSTPGTWNHFSKVGLCDPLAVCALTAHIAARQRDLLFRERKDQPFSACAVTGQDN